MKICPEDRQREERAKESAEAQARPFDRRDHGLFTVAAAIRRKIDEEQLAGARRVEGSKMLHL